MRIVLDTNILISAFVSNKGASAEILERCMEGALELIVSPESMLELRRVLTYPRIRKRLHYSDEQIERFIEFLEHSAYVVTPHLEVRAVPQDADDDKFIAIAIAGAAHYIVTGDEHLLSLGTYQGVVILKPAAFLVVWNTLHRK